MSFTLNTLNSHEIETLNIEQLLDAVLAGSQAA